MTIIEVLNLNKKKRIFFKRPKSINWLWCDSLRFFMMTDHNLANDDSNYETYSLYIEDILAIDWEIKPENKKVAQYMYQPYKDKNSITTELFEDDEQFSKYYPRAISFKRLTEVDPL